ncbi:OmpA family protein [Breznakiellaceae bacterium SP9]
MKECSMSAPFTQTKAACRLCCLLLLGLWVLPLFAQDALLGGRSPWEFSFGIELDNYTDDGVAGGPVLTAKYRIPGIESVLDAGASFGLFGDFKHYTTVEPTLLLRWYPWASKQATGGGLLPGLFAEGKLGAAAVWEDGTNKTFFEASAGVGLQYTISSGWNIEPQLRFGYPFKFGISVAIAWRPQSSSSSQTAAQQTAPRQDTASQAAANDAAARLGAANQGSANQGGAGAGTQASSRAAQGTRDDTEQAEADSQGTGGRSRARAEGERAELPASGPVTLADGRRGYALADTIPFLGDDSVLTQTARERLNAVVEALKQYPNNRVLVQGHAARTGSVSGQQQLSEERARSVANYLIAGGYVPAERLETQALGADVPLATNDTWSGRQQNRRVNIIVLDN